MGVRIHVTAALCCLLATLSPVLAQEDGKLLARAQKYYEARDYQEALAILKDLSADTSASTDVYRLLGHVYYELGHVDDARKALAQAVAHGCLAPDVLARLAQIDQQQDRTASILGALQLRMVVEPEEQAWVILYADILASSGAEGRAEDIYKRVIEADPSSTDAYLRLGNLYLGKGEHVEAISALETAYYLGAPNSTLPATIAELWFNLGDSGQALVWYDRALLSSDKPREDVQLRRAELLLWAKEFARAEEAVKPLVKSESSKTKGKALMLLGQVAMQREQPDVAAGHWKMAIEVGLDDPQVLFFLGGYYFNKGEFKTAARYFDERVKKGAPDEGSLQYLAASSIRAHENERAKKALIVYLELFGVDTEAERLIQDIAREESKPERETPARNHR